MHCSPCVLAETRPVEHGECVVGCMVDDERLSVLVHHLGRVRGVALPVAEPRPERGGAHLHPLPLREVRRPAVRGLHPAWLPRPVRVRVAGDDLVVLALRVAWCVVPVPRHGVPLLAVGPLVVDADVVVAERDVVEPQALAPLRHPVHRPHRVLHPVDAAKRLSVCPVATPNRPFP